MNVDDGIIVHVLVSYTCVSTGLNFTRLGEKTRIENCTTTSNEEG
jgi:hypothetical protein